MKPGDRVVKVSKEAHHKIDVGAYATVIDRSIFNYGDRTRTSQWAPGNDLAVRCDLLWDGYTDWCTYSSNWRKLDDNDTVAWDWRSVGKEEQNVVPQLEGG